MGELPGFDELPARERLVGDRHLLDAELAERSVQVPASPFEGGGH